MFAPFRHWLPWSGFALLIVSVVLVFIRPGGSSLVVDSVPALPSTRIERQSHREPVRLCHPAKQDSLATGKSAKRQSREIAALQAEAPAMPVGFLLGEIEPSLLTDEEDAAVHEAQEKFAAQMARSPESDTASGKYRIQWKLALLQSDDLIRLRLGTDGFNRMNFLAAQEQERRKKP